MQFAEVTQPGVFTRVLRHRNVARYGPAVGVLSCVSLAAAWKPSDTENVICVVRLTTGHWCPGCGLTRGVLALCRGNLATSFAYHPLAIVFLAQAMVYAGYRMTGRKLSGNTRQSVFLANAVALILVFAYRSTLGSFPADGSLTG